MSGLRHVNKDTTSEKDVEAPKPKQASSKDKVSSQEALVTAFSRGRASSRNPVFIAKAIVRKVFILLVTDEEDLTKPGGIITLVKDITLGVILWVISIPILLFLDHRGVIHYHSAHSFRNTAFQMLNDLETIAIIEESTDLHFLPVDIYKSTRAEIDGAAEKLRAKQEILEKHIKESEEKHKEHEIVKPEHERLLHHPLLELDSWCGDCSSVSGQNCDKRVEYLTNTYGGGVLSAKVKAMKNGKCRTVPEPENWCGECIWGMGKTCDKRLEYVVNAHGNNINEAKVGINKNGKCERKKVKAPENWCPECIWGNNKSCDKRVEYLTNTYGTDVNEAKVSAQSKGGCKKIMEPNKSQEEDAGSEQKVVPDMEKYCGTCIWANGKNCDMRVLYLKNTYGISDIDAKISAMEHPNCKKE